MVQARTKATKASNNGHSDPLRSARARALANGHAKAGTNGHTKAATNAKTKAKTTAQAKTKTNSGVKAKSNSQAKAKSNGHVKAKTNSRVKAKTNGQRKIAAKPRPKAVTNGHTLQDKTPKVSDIASDRLQWMDLDGTQPLDVNKIDLPFLPLEDYDVSPLPKDAIEDASGGSVVVGWLGVGQAGNRIIKSFHDLGYHKAIAVNTCPHDLANIDLPTEQKLLMNIGYDGSGKDMVRGAEAAAHYRQAILHHAERIFGNGVDHLMVAVGAGGGTGSGAVAGLLDALRDGAKRMGLKRAKHRIGVICTLPTAGEAASPQIRRNAYQTITQLTDLARHGHIAPLILVDNDKIGRMYPGMTVKSFWPTVNTTVAGLFHVFNRLSSMPSPYTSFDPDDYRSLLQTGGCTVMGLTKVVKPTEPNALSAALTHNLQKTLLADGFDLTTARAAGVIVVGGSKLMAQTPGLQDIINRAFDVMTDLTGNATVYRGIFEDDKESLRAYTIVSGLEPPRDRIDDLRGE